MRGDRHWATRGGKVHNRPLVARRGGLTARQRAQGLHAIGNRGAVQVIDHQRCEWRTPVQRFWMVWREGSNTPTVKHDDEAVARAEAERLARMHTGVFHVLEVIGSCKRHDVDWVNYDEVATIPF